jgi:hypothetical protein
LSGEFFTVIRLHPYPEPFHQCPYCQVMLEVKGWYIPGMRNLADLECGNCGRKFYGDLLAGHGLFYPMLLEQGSGQVHNQYSVGWFARELRDSYSNRQNTPLEMTTENYRTLRRPLLLNCLDAYYGHSLLKLLNAQYYIDHTPEYDLILLIPRFLRWMVPDGAAAIWTVDLPLRQGRQWNDWLAAEIHKNLDHFEEVWLSVAFSHPHPEDYDITRFTKVAPFPVNEWESHLDQPTITFIWREDRLWTTGHQMNRTRARINRLLQRLGVRKPDPLKTQTANIISLAEDLRQQVQNLQFSVAGVGVPGGLPSWIHDLRARQINSVLELSWCQLYAHSHIVVGVHGSNMLLPSGHAGAVVELVPIDRWGNIMQDLLFNTQEIRLVNLLNLMLPISINLKDLSLIISAMLVELGACRLEYSRDTTRHDSPAIANIPKKFLDVMIKKNIVRPDL